MYRLILDAKRDSRPTNIAITKLQVGYKSATNRPQVGPGYQAIQAIQAISLRVYEVELVRLRLLAVVDDHVGSPAEQLSGATSMSSLLPPPTKPKPLEISKIFHIENAMKMPYTLQSYAIHFILFLDISTMICQAYVKQ